MFGHRFILDDAITKRLIKALSCELDICSTDKNSLLDSFIDEINVCRKQPALINDRIQELIYEYITPNHDVLSLSYLEYLSEGILKYLIKKTHGVTGEISFGGILDDKSIVLCASKMDKFLRKKIEHDVKNFYLDHSEKIWVVPFYNGFSILSKLDKSLGDLLDYDLVIDYLIEKLMSFDISELNTKKLKDIAETISLDGCLLIDDFIDKTSEVIGKQELYLLLLSFVNILKSSKVWDKGKLKAKMLSVSPSGLCVLQKPV